MEHKVIRSSNGDVHYWIGKTESNNTDCIVFTHGVTANHTMFQKQIDYFSGKFTLITWDVPCHGASLDYLNFTFRNCANELHSILKAEGIEKVILVGMSMGGYVSQMFGDIYPEMVHGFVSLASTPFGLHYYNKFEEFLMSGIKPLSYLVPKKLLKTIIIKMSTKTRESYDISMEMVKPLTKKQLADQLDMAYFAFTKENKDMHFDFPVLLLLGDKDKTLKISHLSKEWSKNEHCPLHIIKNAAHMLNVDNFREVNSEIENFIESL